MRLSLRASAATGGVSLGRADSGFARRAAGSSAMQVAAAVVASAVAAFAVGALDQPLLVAAAIGGSGLLALGFLRPALFLLVFLLLRPLLDEISDVTIGVPGGNVGGLLGLLLAVMAVGLVLMRRSVLITPAALGFSGIVVVTAGCSLVAMADFGGTVGTDPASEAVRILCALCLILLAANVLRSEARLRKVVVVAGLSGVIPALWALVELPSVIAAGEELARVSGPFVGPNPLGQYLATTSIVLMAMPRDWMSQRARMLALVPQLVAIVPTYSRVGWGMLLVGVTILYWREHKHLLIAMVVVVAAVVMTVPTVHDRVLPPEQATPSSEPTYESYGWRVANWGTLLGEWREEPFTGHGTGTTVYVNPRRPAQFEDQPEGGGFEAHNLVVRVLVEGGLALLLVYIAFALTLAASLRRMVRARWNLRPIARMVAILWFLMLFVGLLTDDSFGNTSVLFLLLALTGALEGTYRATRAAGAPAPKTTTPTSFLPARPRIS